MGGVLAHAQAIIPATLTLLTVGPGDDDGTSQEVAVVPLSFGIAYLF